MRSFDTLSEQEVLALAISLEEEDERIYADFAEGLRAEYPATSKVFDGMREEESGHRRRLIELYQQKFGEHIPLISNRYMETPVFSAAVQVGQGGALVFLTGVLIGNS